MAVAAAGVVGVSLGWVLSGTGGHTASDTVASKPPAAQGDMAQNTAIANVLIQASPVDMQDVADVVNVSGKIALHGLKVHQISSRLPGRIDRMAMVEGSSVKVGEPLAWIYSPEFISAQNEFLLAKRTVRTLNHQATQDLYEDAKVTLEGARNKLRILGASSADVAQLEKTGVAQEYMAITSPINGKVTKRNVDPGGYLDTGSSLGSVADMSALWFLGNAFEGDLVKLKEGQAVNIKVTGVSATDTYLGKSVSFRLRSIRKHMLWWCVLICPIPTVFSSPICLPKQRFKWGADSFLWCLARRWCKTGLSLCDSTKRRWQLRTHVGGHGARQ